MGQSGVLWCCNGHLPCCSSSAPSEVWDENGWMLWFFQLLPSNPSGVRAYCLKSLEILWKSKKIYWNRGLNRLLEWQDFLQDLFRTAMARSMHTWTAWLVLYQAVWKLSPWVEVFLPTALLVHQQCGNQLEETTCFWGCEGWQQGDMLRAAQNIKKWGQRIRQIHMIFPCSRFVSRFLYFISMIRPEMMGNLCGYVSSFLK